MRDIKRIERIISKLREVWYYTADWRFFQMLSNYFGDNDKFYMEDEIVESALDNIIQKLKK